MRLLNKTAIVTGAGSGFGAGIARKFAAEGAQVLVADINGEAAQTIATEINGVPCMVDVADGASVQAMADLAMKEMGNVDIIVNNAGVTHLPAPMETSFRAGFRPRLRCELQICLSHRARVQYTYEDPKIRCDLERCLHRRGQPAPQSQLVQCIQRLDEHRHKNHGR